MTQPDLTSAECLKITFSHIFRSICALQSQKIIAALGVEFQRFFMDNFNFQSQSLIRMIFNVLAV